MRLFCCKESNKVYECGDVLRNLKINECFTLKWGT